MPAFLARYLSSEPGRLARDAVSAGISIAALSREALQDAIVYLPDLSIQRKAVDTHARIAGLLNELNELDTRLLETPKDCDAIGAELSKINNEDRFETWLESLPFPLATVLWLFMTQRNAKDRVDTLLHFFEAYAEFWATTLLSIFLREATQRDEWRPRIISVLSSQKQSLEHASIGTWLTVVELLSKEVRSSQGDKSKLASLKKHAAIVDETFFSVLASKDVLRTLRAANSYRNSWKGHGGIATEDTAELRLSTLRGLLNDLRSVVGEHWSKYALYRVGALHLRNGVYLVQAERVMGTRAPFLTETLELAGPAEADRLHLAGIATRDALPLLPFIKVMPSPRTAMNACYFYNRKTKDGVRFVSYHFAEDSDVTASFDDTAREIESLCQQE